MKKTNLLRHQQKLIKRTLACLGAAALAAALNSSVFAQFGGTQLITNPDDTNLVEQVGTYVISEYYGTGIITPLTINGLTFTNNQSRIGGSPYGPHGTVAFSGGNGSDAANLDIIAEQNTYASSLDFTVPTVAGHSYVLELIFHDNAWETAGLRAFSVNAGYQGHATNLLYANMDLAAIGACEDCAEMVVLDYVVNNSSGSNLEITLTASTNNAIINALALLDVTSPSVQPLLFVGPAAQTNYVGLNAVFTCVAAGPPSTLTYTWASSPTGQNTWTTLTNGPIGDGSGISGQGTATMTVTNLTTNYVTSQLDYQVTVSDTVPNTSVASGPATLTVEYVPGLSLVTNPAQLNLINNGTFYYTEYYGTNIGTLSIGGLNFLNNNARLNVSQTVTPYTGSYPNFGATSDEVNLGLISQSEDYNTSQIYFQIPTINGRSYNLQLLFHDASYSTPDTHIFSVSAGLDDRGGPQPWAPSLDLVSAGAYETQPANILMTTNFTGDGSPMDVSLNSIGFNSPIITAMTLQDVSGAPVPPLIQVNPSSTNIYAGRTLVLNVQAAGTPLNYQWNSSPDNSTWSPVTGANVSGATTNTLTITNITTGQTAYYQAAVTNTATPGTATSSSALVTVLTDTVVITTNTPSSYAYAIKTNSAVDYWRLNEANGASLAYDSLGTKDAAVGSSVTLGAPGPQNPPFPGFEAANTGMQIQNGNQNEFLTAPPLNLNTNAVTLLAWLNPSAQQAAGDGIMMCRPASGSDLSGLRYGVTLQSFNDYSLDYFWNGISYDSGLQVPQNMWSMVGLVITPTNATVYVINSNGVSSWTQTAVNTNGSFSDPFYIGNDPIDGGTGARTFSGSVDEVSVFNRSLSTTQILGLFTIASGISEIAPSAAITTATPQIVSPGQNVTLTATTGGAPIPSLQWQMRPVGLTGSYTNVTGANISGAQTATLTISNATVANVGDYILVASNNVSVAISGVARVLVIQPSNAPALIGEWINGQNNANEVTGQYNHAHDGVASGTVTFQTGSGNVPPAFSSSLYSANFNGSSALIITNSRTTDNDYRLDFDNNITNRFTIAFWAQGFPTSANAFLGKNGTANTQGWRIEHDSNDTPNQWTLEVPGLTAGATAVPQQLNDGDGVPITDNNWHHYCAAYDSFTGLVYLYQDGVCVDIFDRVYYSITVANAAHLALGASESGSLGGFFTGSLFDVRLYNYSVQPGEVQAMISPITTANTIGLYLASTNYLAVGEYTTMSVILPAGATASGPVTVTISNGAPAVAGIVGPTILTFAQNGPLVQTVDVQAFGSGTISFTATASGLNPGSVSDMVAVKVIGPSLIGWWFNGSQTLADQSGYLPAGMEDGVASTGATLGGGSATYAADAPPFYAAVNATNPGTYSSLTNSTNCISIKGTSLRDSSSTYTSTFDDDINMGFSCAFWAKGVPSSGHGWISKNGQNANVAGWMLRSQNADLPSFVVRYAAGSQNNEENPDMDNSINPYNATGFNPTTTWHHWVGTYDGFGGLTKLYVDGNLSATLPNNYGPIAAPVDSCLVIGGVDAADNQNTTASPSFGSFFSGEMFDVRVYNYPLAASEVQSIFTYNPANPANLSVVADTPVIDLTNTGMVSITLPTMAQGNSPISQPVVITVTNSNPSVVSIEGAPPNTNVFTITLPSGTTYQTVRLTLTGLANGTSTISAGAVAGGSTVYGSAQATVNVYGPQLVARWFVGLSNLFEYSGFRSAHTHDCIAVTGASGGDTASTAHYTTNGTANAAPPGFPGASVYMNQTYSIIASNSDGVQGCLFANGTTTADPAYQPTFDDLLANHFTVAFWANLPVVGSQGNWTAVVGKGGEPASDNGDKGWQVRKDGTGSPPEAFDMMFSGSHLDNLRPANNTSSGMFAGSWVYVAVVHDGYAGYRALYINGVPEMEQTSDYGPFALSKDSHFIIGSEEQPTGSSASYAWQPDDQDNSYLLGSLYDMRVYNYALTQAQMVQNMTYTPPSVKAMLAGGNQVQLSWSSLYPGYAVETNGVLTNTNGWAIKPSLTPALVGALQNGQFVVTDTIGDGQLYYRLVFVPQ